MSPNTHNVIGNRSHNVIWTEKLKYLKRGTKILSYEETKFAINL